LEQVEITEEEIAFMESFSSPVCLVESLFHNFDNLAEYDQEKYGNIRLYQTPFISDEAIIDFEATAKLHNLDEKETFQLRKNVGEIICMGARKFGKTLIVEKLDLVLSMLTQGFTLAAFASVDLIHIRAVLDDVKSCFQSHPICRLWNRRITGAPDFQFILKSGYKLNSVNFNIGAKNPGQQWTGKHVSRVYIEEASLETEQVAAKRFDSLSEDGAVFRISGMTDFPQFSPAGKAFHAPENKKHVINLPQYVSPKWDKKEKKDRAEQYGGIESVGYKTFVEGKIVEDGSTVFDMGRIRKACFLENKKGRNKIEIKRFEISKEDYPYFRNRIIVERPNNAERIFISSDVGEKVTEIIVHSEIENTYHYLYNIVLYNLTEPETEEIVNFIIGKLKANVIALDCGDGKGRALYARLELKYAKDNLVWYDGSKKLDVDFEYDENKNIKIEKGKPVYRQEFMSEFSVQQLQNILYAGRVKIPEDFKFAAQFSVVMAFVSGTRTKYKCVSQTGDHLFDAHRVFAIAVFLKKDFNSTPEIGESDWGIGVTG
jgi:hypothetical protein